VIRHTCADEESGRSEVIMSLPTGRLANLHATMIGAFLLNVCNAVLHALLLALLNIEGMDLSSCILYGVIFAVAGFIIAALTALFAQLFANTSSTTGATIFILALFYVIRAVGDISNETLSLITPLGILQRTEVFVANYWWPVFIVIAESFIILLIAYFLNSIRDVNQSFFPAKPGRKTASFILKKNLGFATCLTRNTIIAWLVGVFALAVSYGAVLGDIEIFVNNSDFYALIVGIDSQYSVAQMFTTMVISLTALISSVPLLMLMLHLYNEEKENRTEQILTKAVSRFKYILSFVFIAFVTSILLQSATAIGLYLSASVVLNDAASLSLSYLIKATFLYLPALWLLIGVVTFIIGIFPGATTVVWVYFGVAFFITFISRIPNIIPKWMLHISPFTKIPQLPIDDIKYPTLMIISIIAIVLVAFGVLGYSQRDITAQ